MESATCTTLTTITTVFTTSSSDSMVAMEPTHSTMIMTAFSTLTIGMMTMMEFLKDQSIMMLSKHKDSILETYPPIVSLSLPQSILGRTQRLAHSISQTNTHSTTTTMVLPTKTTTVQEQAAMMKTTITMDGSTNSHGLAITIQMESWTTSTQTMTTITSPTLMTPTHTTLRLQPVTPLQAIFSTHRSFGTSLTIETTQVA